MGLFGSKHDFSNERRELQALAKENPGMPFQIVHVYVSKSGYMHVVLRYTKTHELQIAYKEKGDYFKVSNRFLPNPDLQQFQNAAKQYKYVQLVTEDKSASKALHKELCSVFACVDAAQAEHFMCLISNAGRIYTKEGKQAYEKC